MKKIILCLVVVVGLFAITGCGEDSKLNENTINKDINNTNNEERKVYRCTDMSDTDEGLEYKLYYENSKLTKVDSILNYCDNEDYQYAKKEASEYSGVSVKKEGSKVTMEFDINNGGLKALEAEDGDVIFQQAKGDESFENLNKYMKQHGFICNLENDI